MGYRVIYIDRNGIWQKKDFITEIEADSFIERLEYVGCELVSCNPVMLDSKSY